MITKNEKAKGLWWRLLATLPVLAFLMIANTKVTAQEKTTESQRITVEMGQFEIYDDDGFPMLLKDTIIYNEDGSYVKCETSDSDVLDPNTGEPLKKMTITTHKADGSPANHMSLHWEIHGDTTLYTAEPFSITEESLGILLDGLSALEDAPSNDSIYQIVDEMPQFPGGEAAMMKFVANNIKYPQEAKDNNIDGRVFISFVVEKDGSVSNVKVMRGIGGGCDEEAVRVISAMPKWKPGMKDGKPVRVSYMMPLTFKLTDSQPAKPAQKADASKPDMKPDKNGVYQIVEEMPEFPGGVDALMQFLSKNIKYPEKAKDENISGRVFLGFVVEKDGSINEVKVLRGIGGGCDEEAVRVVKAMPKWKPGKMEGQPVRVSYQIPINFKLDGSTTKGLANTTWEGSGTGSQDGTNYTMSMTMEFESDKSGYFVMTLTANKEGQTAKVFEDVGLPFNYTFDGKKIGVIQPKNPDGSDLGETPTPPYGFLKNSDGTITVSFYDFKEDIGVEKIVFKKVK